MGEDGKPASACLVVGKSGTAEVRAVCSWHVEQQFALSVFERSCCREATSRARSRRGPPLFHFPSSLWAHITTSNTPMHSGIHSKQAPRTTLHFMVHTANGERLGAPCAAGPLVRLFFPPRLRRMYSSVLTCFFTALGEENPSSVVSVRAQGRGRRSGTDHSYPEREAGSQKEQTMPLSFHV